MVDPPRALPDQFPPTVPFKTTVAGVEDRTFVLTRIDPKVCEPFKATMK
jgi:hypothetical protein